MGAIPRQKPLGLYIYSDNLVSERFTIHYGIGFPMHQLLRCGNCAVEQDCAYWEVRVCLGQSTCRLAASIAMVAVGQQIDCDPNSGLRGAI